MKPLRRTLLGLVLAGLTVWGSAELSDPIRIYEGKGFSRIVFDRNGALLDAQVAPDGRYRSPVPLERIPRACIEAAETYEDQWFRYHPGVNPVAMIRAAASTLGSHRVGGSTLTMQVVRLRTGRETKSVSGKLRQIWDALVLERHLSKRDVLQAYFTFAPYGGAIEGIGAASALYFGKQPEELSPAECAALAVLPQSPSERYGFTGPGFEQSYRRLALAMKLPESAQSLNFPQKNAIQPPHFARHLTQRILAGGGVVQSTVERKLQDETERVVADYLTSRAELGLKNAAVLAVDGTSGEVLSYVGSRDYSDPEIRGFVDGVIAKRSPGSLLKPFVYGAGISEGMIIPDSIVADIPVKLTSYEPENFERDFLGLISARDALVKSRNIPALMLNTKLGEKGLYTLLRQADVSLPRDEDYYGAAVVLGGIEVSLYDAVRLYTAFVSRGETVPLQLLRAGKREDHHRVFSAEAASMTRRMLETNPPPPGFGLRQVAWKTGTSSGGRDAWAVGVSGKLVLGVWLGNFDGQPNANFIGRDVAGPLLFTLLERMRQTPEFTLLASLDSSAAGIHLGKVEICPESGMIRGPHCPHAKQAEMIPGVSPIRRCTLHREEGSVSPVYPSEVDAHLMEAGMKLGPQTVRPTTSQKDAPRIVSPEEGLEYRVPYGAVPEIELRGSVDGESRRVYWYVNGELLGEAEPGRPVFWNAVPGVATVRLVDSFGQSDVKRVKVVVQEEP